MINDIIILNSTRILLQDILEVKKNFISLPSKYSAFEGFILKK